MTAGAHVPTLPARSPGPGRRAGAALNALGKGAIAPILTGVALIAGWELAATPPGRAFWISSPRRIAARAVEWIGDGTAVLHVRATLTVLIVGFLIGAIAALVLAFAAYRWRRAFSVVNPFVMAIYSIPKVALAPVLILWLGIGMSSKIALVVVITLFLMFYMVLTGLDTVSAGLMDSVRLMGASESWVMLHVLLPASRASISIATRMAFPKAFTGAILGEIIASNRGLGYLARRSAGLLDTTGTLTAIMFIVAIAVPIYYLLKVRHREDRDLGLGAAI